MSRKPSKRPFRKRYIVIQWNGDGDEALLKKKINHALRKHGGECPELTKPRPWIWLIEFNPPFGIAMAPHTCLEEAKEVLNSIIIEYHPVSTKRTSGTLRKAREIISGKRTHITNNKKARDSRR